MYIGAFILYFCFNVLVKVFNGQYREAIWYISTYLRIQYTSKIILFNESITAMHLWFLGSLIYLYVIRYFIIKSKVNDNIIYALSCLILLINLVLGIGFSAMGIALPSFLLKNYIMRNFLFIGFPFFTLGQFIKSREEVILNKVTGRIIALLILLSIIDTFVVYRIDSSKDLYVGSVLLSFALFILALKLKEKEYNKNMITLFNTNTGVYLIHVMAGDILAMTGLENFRFYLYLRPVFIFIVSVIVCLLISLLKKPDIINNIKSNK